jgi:hypothetical protein
VSRKNALRAESAAWLDLAEWCADGDCSVGICCLLRHPTLTPLCVLDDAERMAPRMERHSKDSTTGCYLHGLDTGRRYIRLDQHTPRVIFCLLMALECVDEAKHRRPNA